MRSPLSSCSSAGRDRACRVAAQTSRRTAAVLRRFAAGDHLRRWSESRIEFTRPT
jgi:hypothetical protein